MTFDKIYHESLSTPDIFYDHYQHMILQALDGYNTTIFAYGQTSSGKTHTMFGSDEEPGIIQLAAKEIFSKVRDLEVEQESYNKSLDIMFQESGEAFARQNGTLVPPTVIKKEMEVSVSFIEIYNEKVNDLINPLKKDLEIREDKKQIIIEGLSRHVVKTPDQIIELIEKGRDNRKMASTKMNAKSSRSHVVFRIEVKLQEKNIQTRRRIIKSSIINLVDLAGSEGVGKMNARGTFQIEGNNINKSLLALSNVIYKLG